MTPIAHKENGFTLIEALAVLLVVATVITLVVPAYRERERAKLQAVADATPEDVFTIRAWPQKDRYEPGEDFIFFCEIGNSTSFDLDFKWRAMSIGSVHETNGYILEWARVDSQDVPAELLREDDPETKIDRVPSGGEVLYRVGVDAGRSFSDHRSRISRNEFKVNAAIQIADKDYYWMRDGRTFQSEAFTFLFSTEPESKAH